MLLKITNTSPVDRARIRRVGAADVVLGPGQSLVIADDHVAAFDDAPAQPQTAPVAVPAIGSAQQTPPEGVARAPAPAPVVLPDAYIAGSERGGPGRPIDPVPMKDRPEPKNNGKTNDWDPNGNSMAAMLPPPKRRLHSDFGDA